MLIDWCVWMRSMLCNSVAIAMREKHLFVADGDFITSFSVMLHIIIVVVNSVVVTQCLSVGMVAN